MTVDPDPYTSLQLEHAALLTIDVQKDTMKPSGPLEVPGTASAVPAMARLADAFRAAGRPIVHVVRLYLPDGSNADACRRGSIEAGLGALLPGTEGAELAEPLRSTPLMRLDPETLLAGELQLVADKEWCMYKPRWGAFYRTPLEAHLRHLGVTTVVVCGCNFPNCPRATIYEASERDFRIAVASDAVSGVYARGLGELRSIGVVVAPVDELIQTLRTALRRGERAVRAVPSNTAREGGEEMSGRVEGGQNVGGRTDDGASLHPRHQRTERGRRSKRGTT